MKVESVEKYVIRLGLFGIHPIRVRDSMNQVRFFMELPEDISFDLSIGINRSDEDYGMLEQIVCRGNKGDYLDITDTQTPRILSANDFHTYYTPCGPSWEDKLKEFDAVCGI
jgi:hypothetical protein